MKTNPSNLRRAYVLGTITLVARLMLIMGLGTLWFWRHNDLEVMTFGFVLVVAGLVVLGLTTVLDSPARRFRVESAVPRNHSED